MPGKTGLGARGGKILAGKSADQEVGRKELGNGQQREVGFPTVWSKVEAIAFYSISKAVNCIYNIKREGAIYLVEVFESSEKTKV